MWSPPFPPEEFDGLDDEIGMDSEDLGLGASLGGYPPYHVGSSGGRKAAGAGDEKRQVNG
ncbi:unnamed protein product, partial [Ectocarpus sp. 12 AP-2014]